MASLYGSGAGKHLDRPAIDAACNGTGSSGSRRRTLTQVVLLAVELLHEGREGRKTLFVIEDVGFVLAHESAEVRELPGVGLTIAFSRSGP